MDKISKILLILTLVHSLCIDVYAQQSALKPVLNERTNLYGFKDANDNLIVDYIYEEYADMGEVISKKTAKFKLRRYRCLHICNRQ